VKLPPTHSRLLFKCGLFFCGHMDSAGCPQISIGKLAFCNRIGDWIGTSGHRCIGSLTSMFMYPVFKKKFIMIPICVELLHKKIPVI